MPVKADAKALFAIALLAIIHKGQVALQSINSTYTKRLLLGLQQAKEALADYESQTAHYESNASHKRNDLYEITMYEITNQVYIVIDACIKLNSNVSIQATTCPRSDGYFFKNRRSYT
ncbi:hypothetical protein [Xanthocytophaga flava]|uniref:hypothetical protein n=1 Tax=Xanthocytophaga flava TaxID=3048013 RepID=UPI0028D77C8E|nr:hypothetical protein [Xanthocytophaga flavus]MDJ1470192.1 hypothetical protein [Xanthocytophaga flavus]